MNTPSSINVEIETIINAPNDQVFTALTTGIAIWWGSTYLKLSETRNLILEPKVGGRFYERRDNSDSYGALHGTVIVIDRPKLLKLQGPFGMEEHGGFGIVSFELKSQGLDTFLKFSHQAIGNFDQEVEKHYTAGWHELLCRLKSFIEEGHADGVVHDPNLSSFGTR